MKNFNDILATFANINNIKEIKLFDADGYEAGNILNIPGSQGSIKLYNHLFLIKLNLMSQMFLYVLIMGLLTLK